jgi:molybdopterin synthase sulfur carrier subunit
MPVEVRVPTVLRKYTNGERAVEARGSNVLEVLDDVDKRFPGFKSQVVADDGQLHRFINLYLNDEDVRYLQQLDTKVGPDDIVAILPAVAGG